MTRVIVVYVCEKAIAVSLPYLYTFQEERRQSLFCQESDGDEGLLDTGHTYIWPFVSHSPSPPSWHIQAKIVPYVRTNGGMTPCIGQHLRGNVTDILSDAIPLLQSAGDCV